MEKDTFTRFDAERYAFERAQRSTCPVCVYRSGGLSGGPITYYVRTTAETQPDGAALIFKVYPSGSFDAISI